MAYVTTEEHKVRKPATIYHPVDEVVAFPAGTPVEVRKGNGPFPVIIDFGDGFKVYAADYRSVKEVAEVA